MDESFWNNRALAHGSHVQQDDSSMAGGNSLSSLYLYPTDPQLHNTHSSSGANACVTNDELEPHMGRKVALGI